MALTDKLTAIGDAIRAKTGDSGLLTLDDMPTAIAGIGGGGNDIAVTKFRPSNGSSLASLKTIKWDDFLTDPKEQLITFIAYSGNWAFNIPELDIWNIDNESELDTLYPNQGAMNWYHASSSQYYYSPEVLPDTQYNKKSKFLFLDTGYMNMYNYTGTTWKELPSSASWFLFIYRP